MCITRSKCLTYSVKYLVFYLESYILGISIYSYRIYSSIWCKGVGLLLRSGLNWVREGIQVCVWEYMWGFIASHAASQSETAHRDIHQYWSTWNSDTIGKQIARICHILDEEVICVVFTTGIDVTVIVKLYQV